MARAVFVTERIDAFREDLDPARGSTKRMRLWIGAEVIETDRGFRRAGHLEITLPQEGIEIRQLEIPKRCLLARGLVEVAQPPFDVAVLGIGARGAQPLSEIGKNRVVVAGLARRIYRLFHRDHVAVAAGRPD